MAHWAACLFRPSKGQTTQLEVNAAVCPTELHEQLLARGTALLRPRGSTILYQRDDDAGGGAFVPPVLIYLKQLRLVDEGLDICVKRTLRTHFIGRAVREARLQVQLQHPHLLPALASVRGKRHYYLVLPAAEGDLWAEAEAMLQQGQRHPSHNSHNTHGHNGNSNNNSNSHGGGGGGGAGGGSGGGGGARGYSEAELASIARQMLLGLEHLHALHLAHRGGRGGRGRLSSHVGWMQGVW